MKKKANKKTSAKTPESVDLIAEAMSRLGNKPLFPEKVEFARKSMRNTKIKDL